MAEQNNNVKVALITSSASIVVAIITGVFGMKQCSKSSELERRVDTLNQNIITVQQRITTIEQTNTKAEQKVSDNGTAVSAGRDAVNSGNHTNQKFDNSIKQTSNNYSFSEKNNNDLNKKIIRVKLNELWNLGKDILIKYQESNNQNVFNKDFEKEANNWYFRVINFLNNNLDKSYVDAFKMYHKTILSDYHKSVLVNPTPIDNDGYKPDEVKEKFNFHISKGLEVRISNLQKFIEKNQ